MSLIEFLFASGITGLLFTICHDIGKMRGGVADAAHKIKIHGRTLKKHDARISNLEKPKEQEHERLAEKPQ